MRLSHCSNLLKYIMMVLSFILIFACFFPFGTIDTDELSESDAKYVNSITHQQLIIEEADEAAAEEAEVTEDAAAAEGEATGAPDNHVMFNGRIGVLNYLTGSTGIVTSSELSLYSWILLIVPVIMFIVFFLWRWVSDTVTGIIMVLLSAVEMIFIFLFSNATVTAMNTNLPALADYDILNPTILMYATLIVSGVLLLLGILLTIWNTLFKVKEAKLVK